MRSLAKEFLDHRISRRTFVTRLAQLGVASASADRLVASLAASAERPPAAGRITEGLTGGELMAECLLDWKTDYVFGLAGSEEVGFLDALVDRVALQYVQGLHEGCVMPMADGYARAAGKPSFVNLHSVAGTAYALGQIVNAYKDHVPIVISAGRQDTAVRGQNAFLEAINLNQLPRDYTRWTWDLLTSQSIPEVLRRAFVLSRVPPGGPTFLTVSKDLWEHRVDRAEIIPADRSRLEVDIHPDPGDVVRTVDILLAAELPVIVAGKELGKYGGIEAVTEIAELLGAPICADLFASHSPVTAPTTHPLYGGYFAEDPAFPSGIDAFWSVGGTMFSVGAATPAPLVPRGASIVHTALDADEIGRTYPVDVGMMANVASAAADVLAELRRRTLPAAIIADRRRRVLDYAAARRARLEGLARERWDQRPIASERLTLELNRLMDPGAIVVTELITEEQLASSYFEFNQATPGRLNLTTSGGCLGWGLPAAIGAKIAQPDRPVVALVGDGSFQFGVQALWTAARYEVPVAIVIWNNNQYQANRKFLHLYGGRAAATGRYPGCSLASPDLDHIGIAKGYGVEGERVREPAALGPALTRCFAAVEAGRPYVVDVEIAKRFGGAESTWHDSFSIARRQPRRS